MSNKFKNTGMDKETWNKLMNDETLQLTFIERQAGWHFCPEWEALLIHKSWPEAKCCLCFKDKE